MIGSGDKQLPPCEKLIHAHMHISILANVRRFMVVIASLIHMAVPAAEQPGDEDQRLDRLLLANWDVGLDSKGYLSVGMKIPLRVSTYSQPAFIHRGQLERLQKPFQDLAGMCLKQRGQWSPTDTLAAPVKAIALSPSNSADVAEAIQAGAPTVETARRMSEIGAESATRDAYKATLSALARTPDHLVTDSMEYAGNQKWLGSFKYGGPASNWTAAIVYRDSKSRGSGAMIYKDIILRVSVQENR